MVDSTVLPPHEPSIKDYTIGLLIGDGSFSKVWYGQHKATGREVALKVVERISCTKHGFVLTSVRQEQALLRQLKESPYIVNLLSSFFDREYVYMVLECCEYGTLEDLLHWRYHEHHHHQQPETDPKNNPVHDNPGEWSCRIATYGYQILQGLSVIHTNGFIHADLTPSNVLLVEKGYQIRLADFGSAIAMDSRPESSPSATPWKMTRTDYAAPELLKSQLATMYDDNDKESHRNRRTVIGHMIAVDIWALGCLLFAAFGGQGRTPFHTSSDALAVDAIMAYARLPDQASRRQWLMTQTAHAAPDCDVALDEQPWIGVILRYLNPVPEGRLFDMDNAADCGQFLSGSAGATEERHSVIVEDVYQRLYSGNEFWRQRCPPPDTTKSNNNHECFQPIPLPSWRIQQNANAELREGSWTAFLD